MRTQVMDENDPTEFLFLRLAIRDLSLDAQTEIQVAAAQMRVPSLNTVVVRYWESLN